MASFNRYNLRWDDHGNRRSEEELDQMELNLIINKKKDKQKL